MRLLIRIQYSAIVFLLILSPSISNADECSILTSTSTITRPGRYCLGKNIIANEYGIRINSSKVDLNLQGHTIAFPKKTDILMVGISISENINNVNIHNGEIEGASIGINVTAGNAITIDKLLLKNIGAIGINATAENIEIKNNTINGVGMRPLATDNAYAIGINLGSKAALVFNNKILNIKRQNLESNVTGEPVGILVTSSCDNCVVTDNTIYKNEPEENSYGIWNAALGKVHISKNKIAGFRNGVVSAGHQVSITKNTISCNAGAAQSIGFFSLARDFKKSDSFIGFNGNTMKDCNVEYLSCMGLLCENHALKNDQLSIRFSPSKTK